MIQNKTKEEKLHILTTGYNKLRKAGVIKTWTDMADLMDVNRSGLSAAKNGNEKYLTDSLVSKVELYASDFDHIIEYDETKTTEDNIDRGMTALAPIPQPIKQIPTIPIHAYRAVNFDVMEYFANTTDQVKMSPIIMQFPGTDCYYFVNSEDMSPHLRTNDLLCLSRLPDDAKVTNGDICIINTKSQGLLERFVYDDGDALLVKSSQPRWTDMRIPKDEIYNIFRILGGIRTNI